MNSSDRCIQPTCRMCSMKGGAPSRLSGSHTSRGTRWSGPACKGRTTLPKVPLSPEPRAAPGAGQWATGSSKGRASSHPYLAGAEQWDPPCAAPHSVPKCPSQSPFIGASPASQNQVNKSSQESFEGWKVSVPHRDLFLSRPSTSGSFPYFPGSLVSN